MPDAIEAAKETTSGVICAGIKNSGYTSYCICEFPRCRKMHGNMYYALLDKSAEQPISCDKTIPKDAAICNELCDFVEVEIVTETSLIDLIKLFDEISENLSQRAEKNEFGVWINPYFW